MAAVHTQAQSNFKAGPDGRVERPAWVDAAESTPDTPVDQQEPRVNYQIDPITLHFRDAGVEEHYATRNFEEQIGLTRFSIAMGAVIFSLYALFDPYIIPEIVNEAAAIRLGVAAPFYSPSSPFPTCPVFRIDIRVCCRWQCAFRAWLSWR